MSKSKQNYPPPQEVIEELGADALRAYLINSPIVRAEPLRFQKDGVRDIIRTTLLPLINSWSFFTMYANVDGWTPQSGLTVDGQTITQSVADRNELDRWLISMLKSLIEDVNTQMEGYYLYKVVPAVLSFIDHLTNWYIRRSRRRFWGSPTWKPHRTKQMLSRLYTTVWLSSLKYWRQCCHSCRRPSTNIWLWKWVWPKKGKILYTCVIFQWCSLSTSMHDWSLRSL